MTLSRLRIREFAAEYNRLLFLDEKRFLKAAELAAQGNAELAAKTREWANSERRLADAVRIGPKADLQAAKELADKARADLDLNRNRYAGLLTEVDDYVAANPDEAEFVEIKRRLATIQDDHAELERQVADLERQVADLQTELP